MSADARSLDAYPDVGAHKTIAKIEEDFAATFGAAKAPRTVPVTPATVYRLQSLFRLAFEAGFPLNLGAPEGLSAKENAFYLDFKHRFIEGTTPPGEEPGPLIDDALSFAASLANIAFTGRRQKRRWTCAPPS